MMIKFLQTPLYRAYLLAASLATMLCDMLANGAQLVAGAFLPNLQNSSFARILHSMVAKDAAKSGLKLWSE